MKGIHFWNYPIRINSLNKHWYTIVQLKYQSTLEELNFFWKVRNLLNTHIYDI